MKEIEDYFVPVTVYLVPQFRNGNSLRIEFKPFYFVEQIKKYQEFLYFLRDLRFSCSESKSTYSTMTSPNIIDITLPLYLDEKALVKDLVAELEKRLYEDYGENSVLDRTRTTIKKESNKMKT